MDVQIWIFYVLIVHSSQLHIQIDVFPRITYCRSQNEGQLLIKETRARFNEEKKSLPRNRNFTKHHLFGDLYEITEADILFEENAEQNKTQVAKE